MSVAHVNQASFPPTLAPASGWNIVTIVIIVVFGVLAASIVLAIVVCVRICCARNYGNESNSYARTNNPALAAPAVIEIAPTQLVSSENVNTVV